MGNQGSVGASPTTMSTLSSRGIKSMDPAIAKKLVSNRGGITYHMRVVIRGERETGKSALMRRLEGGDFIATHDATPHIQVAHINWNYKATNEVVLVEVWDVVDKGFQTQSQTQPMTPTGGTTGQQTGQTGQTGQTPLLDASFVDVYQGCHAVILLVDPTREWTFDYVKRELPKIPKHLDILLLANFRDAPSTQRVVTEAALENFMRTQPETVKYLECSMKNGYGLRHFYNFLNVPFLKLKISTLTLQLKQAKTELTAAEKEVELLLEQDYDSYLKWLAVQVNPDGKKDESAQSARTPSAKDGKDGKDEPTPKGRKESSTVASAASSIFSFIKSPGSVLSGSSRSPLPVNSVNRSSPSPQNVPATPTAAPQSPVIATSSPPSLSSSSSSSSSSADDGDDSLESFKPADSVDSSFFGKTTINKEIAERAERTRVEIAKQNGGSTRSEKPKKTKIGLGRPEDLVDSVEVDDALEVPTVPISKSPPKHVQIEEDIDAFGADETFGGDSVFGGGAAMLSTVKPNQKSDLKDKQIKADIEAKYQAQLVAEREKARKDKEEKPKVKEQPKAKLARPIANPESDDDIGEVDLGDDDDIDVGDEDDEETKYIRQKRINKMKSKDKGKSKSPNEPNKKSVPKPITSSPDPSVTIRPVKQYKFDLDDEDDLISDEESTKKKDSKKNDKPNGGDKKQKLKGFDSDISASEGEDELEVQPTPSKAVAAKPKVSDTPKEIPKKKKPQSDDELEMGEPEEAPKAEMPVQPTPVRSLPPLIISPGSTSPPLSSKSRVISNITLLQDIETSSDANGITKDSSVPISHSTESPKVDSFFAPSTDATSATPSSSSPPLDDSIAQSALDEFMMSLSTTKAKSPPRPTKSAVAPSEDISGGLLATLDFSNAPKPIVKAPASTASGGTKGDDSDNDSDDSGKKKKGKDKKKKKEKSKEKEKDSGKKKKKEKEGKESEDDSEDEGEKKRKRKKEKEKEKEKEKTKSKDGEGGDRDKKRGSSSADKAKPTETKGGLKIAHNSGSPTSSSGVAQKGYVPSSHSKQTTASASAPTSFNDDDDSFAVDSVDDFYSEKGKYSKSRTSSSTPTATSYSASSNSASSASSSSSSNPSSAAAKKGGAFSFLDRFRRTSKASSTPTNGGATGNHQSDDGSNSKRNEEYDDV